MKVDSPIDNNGRIHLSKNGLIKRAHIDGTDQAQDDPKHGCWHTRHIVGHDTVWF